MKKVIGIMMVLVATAGCSGTAGKTKQAEVRYSSCADVKAAGKAPLHKGTPGYGKHLDRDGDGTACDS